LLLTAGLFGASLVFAIAWLIPEAGASAVVMKLIAGQILGQYGSLKVLERRITIRLLADREDGAVSESRVIRPER